jgi:cation/acetate symporter
MTGNPIPQLGMGGTITGSDTYLLDKLNGLSTDLGFAVYTDGTKSMIDVFAITLALMVGTAGLPHVIVRFFTVKRVKDARKSAGYALVLIAILYTTAPAIAVFAKTNLIETVNGKDYTSMPAWFTKWEKTGLLTFEDKNGDGKIQYYNDNSKDTEFLAAQEAKGNKGSELTIDKDIMVLANPEIANLPNWVIALVAAGALAAALSTAAGLLLVISASVSHDIIKKMINPDISEKGELWAARGAAAVAVVIAGYFGINPPGFVAAVVALAFGLAAASLFPAIILGIFDKKMNSEGAVSGMVIGLLLMIFYMLKFKFGIFDGGKEAVAGLKASWWFGISPEGFGTIAMLVNFAVAFTVKRFTPEPPQDVQDIVEHIRIPSGAGESTH